MRLSFTVPGLPVAQPRQRHRIVAGKASTFVHNYTPAKAPVNVFKATVRMAACQAMRVRTDEPLVLWPGPVGVCLTFVFPRPGRLVWKRRPMVRCWHDCKPDAENVAKAVLDALTGVVWKDDAQVARLCVTKQIAAGGEQPHVEIRIETLETFNPGENHEPEKTLFDAAGH